jgi:hypothetical protein
MTPGRNNEAPVRNHLLAAFPGDVFERLRPNSESVRLRLGRVIHESNGALSHVYSNEALLTQMSQTAACSRMYAGALTPTHK